MKPKRVSDSLSEALELGLAEVPNLITAKGLKLLLFQWVAPRQRRDVPMDMPVSLLATEAQDIKALARHDFLDRQAYPANYGLRRMVLGVRRVIQHPLPMCL